MLDEIDVRILELLQENGRMSHEEVSKHLNLTRPAIHRRIYKMEEKGIIDGYRVIINWEKIGYSVDTFVLVKVNTNNFNEMIENIMAIKDRSFKIFSCYRVTGEHCIMLHIKTMTPSDLTKFYDLVLEVEGVVDTKTLLILKERKGDYKLFGDEE